MRADEIAPKKLVVFDIDDTLVHTQTKVHVVKDGEIIDSLNSHDFTHYKLKPGEEFDFSGFRNAREFFEKSRPIIPMMNQLKRDIATGNKVVMVTARADFDDRELFLDTFRKFGIDMSKVHVYRAGNSKQGTTEERKKAIIKTLLDKDDYSKAIMYDDALPNLHTFMELKRDHPKTRFYAWHVSLEGEASEYMRESMVSEKRRRKSRWAAYGPGPYGGYGYLTGYSGDGGIGEDQDLTELNVVATLKFIKDAHGDQLYGRMPYWQHPRAVALTGRKIFGSRFNSDAVKAAFLHDVVEDTGTELSDLKELGFSDRVIEAVRLLTKDTSLTYFQNIDRIIQSGNEIAQMVKYADNYENYTSDKSDWDSDRTSSSNKKYLKSLNKLGDHLGTKHHIDEASYEGNIGAMEVAKFYQKATDEEKKTLKDLINKKKLGLAWHLIQKVTGVKLQGKEFQEDHTAEVVLDTGEKKRLRYQPTNKDIVDVIINYYLKQGVKVLKVNGEEIEWDDTVKEGFQQRSIDKLMALGMQGPYSKRDLVGINRAWSNTLKGIQSSQIMVQDPDNPRHSAWISPDQSGRWIVGAEDGYAIKSGPQALQQLKFFLKVDEAWSEKYKRSINCSDPKGFSQRAHCQGRKKNEDGVVQEYEQDTKRSKEIEAVLKKAGYKFKGGGAEATAWSKDDGRVIKIIMPDENIINTKPAMKSFKRFYKLTKDSPNRHWPKFYPMKDELGQESEYAKFRIDNRKYMQISMEHLFELSDYEKELIEEMSSAVVDGKEYEDFISEMLPVIKKYYPKVYLVAKKLGEQMPTLYTAMELAYRRSSWKYEWDLHGGNAMKRGNGIVVITDPFIQWAT